MMGTKQSSSVRKIWRKKTAETRLISGGFISHLNASANDATPSSVIALSFKLRFNKVVLLLQTHPHIKKAQQ